MNIFFLSRRTRQCAKWHCDKHVVKMILESAQLLYTAHHETGSQKLETAPVCASTGKRGYKSAHKNHPCAIWVRQSLAHYYWLVWLAKDLIVEHEYRFSPEKPHGCLEHVLWLESNAPPITNMAWRDPPMAMPDECKGPDVVEAYRKYYNGPKRDRGLLKYTKRHMPHILTKDLLALI